MRCLAVLKSSMALVLRSTDNVLFSLGAREQETLSHSWQFFSSLLSGRWTVETEAQEVPFSSSQLECFLSLVAGQRPHYTDELDKTCEYFSPKHGRWLLSVVLPERPSLALYGRIGLAGCEDVNAVGVCHCCNVNYSDYLKHSLPVAFVDKYVIMGVLRHARLAETDESIYPSLVRTCRELGDKYYEAYFAVVSYSRNMRDLVTYDHIKTTLRYHYEHSKSKYGDSTKLVPDTLPGGTRETELPIWTTTGGCLYSRHNEVALTCVSRDLLFCLRSAMVSLLTQFSTECANISKWLQVYRLHSHTVGSDIHLD